MPARDAPVSFRRRGRPPCLLGERAGKELLATPRIGPSVLPSISVAEEDSSLTRKAPIRVARHPRPPALDMLGAMRGSFTYTMTT